MCVCLLTDANIKYLWRTNQYAMRLQFKSSRKKLVKSKREQIQTKHIKFFLYVFKLYKSRSHTNNKQAAQSRIRI